MAKIAGPLLLLLGVCGLIAAFLAPAQWRGREQERIRTSNRLFNAFTEALGSYVSESGNVPRTTSIDEVERLLRSKGANVTAADAWGHRFRYGYAAGREANGDPGIAAAVAGPGRDGQFDPVTLRLLDSPKDDPPEMRRRAREVTAAFLDRQSGVASRPWYDSAAADSVWMGERLSTFGFESTAADSDIPPGIRRWGQLTFGLPGLLLFAAGLALMAHRYLKREGPTQ